MSDEEREFKDRLNEINQTSLAGKTTLKAAFKAGMVPPSNKKMELFNTMEKLFSLASDMLKHLDDKNTNDINSVNIRSGLTDLMKKEIGDIIEQKLKENTHTSLTSGTTSKQEVTNDLQPKETHKLVMEKAENGEDSSTNTGKIDWTEVKRALKSVPVIKTSSRPNGSTMIHFKTKKDLETAEKELKKNEQIKVTTRSETEKKLNPKITIFNIDPDITSKEELLEELLLKNEHLKTVNDLNEEIKVVFIDTSDRFAVIQMSLKMRDAIRRNDDKVSIGLQMHTVKDRFHVVQCYHCQRFGHMANSPYCKQRQSHPTCFYCAGDHASKDCQHKKNKKTEKRKCSNCCSSNTKEIKQNATTHVASDTLCPSFVKEKERLMNRTLGAETTKNEYLQWVREKRIHLRRA